MSVKIMGLVFDLELEPDEKLVLLAYADHASHDGGSIFPAVKTIAEKTGYSDRSVQRITHALQEKGLLVADGQGPHRTNRWRIPISGGVILSPRTNGTGDMGITEGVTSETKRGDIAVSPESSLTVIQPSTRAPLSKSETTEIIQDANREVDFILESERKALSSWAGREKVPEPIRALLDFYVELTGQRPMKGQLMDWIATGNDWLELGINRFDLRQAYDKANPPDGHGFAVVRPGSLTATAGAFAGERRKTHQSGSSLDRVLADLREDLNE